MKQTAVDWLHKEYKRILKDNDISVLQAFEITDKYNQAIKMEKEQIKDAYDHHRCIGNFENGKQYYKETFNIKEK